MVLLLLASVGGGELASGEVLSTPLSLVSSVRTAWECLIDPAGGLARADFPTLVVGVFFTAAFS